MHYFGAFHLEMNFFLAIHRGLTIKNTLEKVGTVVALVDMRISNNAYPLNFNLGEKCNEISHCNSKAFQTRRCA